MKQCIIFCAAEFDGLLSPVGPEDYVIAADGGLRHCEAAGVRPDAVLGDFDSLGYVPRGANVFPVEKDDTDAMLAVRHGLALGYREFLLYGSLDGKRLDHTLANYQTLCFLCRHGARGTLVGRDFLATAVKDGSISFPAGKQGTVSVFCLGSDAHGVTLRGLYYPLTDATLTAAFPLGVSNHFTGEEAKVEVRDGTLLVMWER
ncbi:MAG: thiamine diphosphokinase [Eubacteriales bacterium]|nr:thiamine diphosphokinase [Eubacteriales bacterium]